jgi:Fungal specific transcription factor domain
MHTFFYDSTCKMLDDFEGKETSEGFGGIEHIQARVLLPIYDFMRTNDQRGWLSAGRCFRLLQLQRMYEIDGPEHLSSKSPSPDVEAWSYTEEKRRTFWMAYCLDRFISIRNETPLTLNENVVGPSVRRRPCVFTNVPQDRNQAPGTRGGFST